MNEVRIALVGCGAHSRENLLPGLLQLADARLVALCDNADKQLTTAARLAPSASTCRDYEKIIDPDRIDALIVAGPPQLHATCAALALERGIHVLVEKPPTADCITLRALAEAARAHGRVSGVAHNLRYANATQHVADILHSVEFGPITAIGLTYLASGPRGPRWGIDDQMRAFLLSHALHAFDLLGYFGGAIHSVASSQRCDPYSGCQLACSLTFCSGAVGTLLVGTGAPNFQLDLLVTGTAGTSVRMGGLNSVFAWGGPGSSSRVAHHWQPRTLDTGYRSAGYLNELEAFVQAVRDNSAYSPSFEDELAAYNWIERLAGQNQGASTEILQGDSETVDRILGERPESRGPSPNP